MLKIVVHEYVVEYPDIYEFHLELRLWGPNKKLTWVEFKPTISDLNWVTSLAENEMYLIVQSVN